MPAGNPSGWTGPVWFLWLICGLTLLSWGLLWIANYASGGKRLRLRHRRFPRAAGVAVGAGGLLSVFVAAYFAGGR